MQHTAHRNQIVDEIINLVVNSSYSSTLLEDLAVTIGTFFQVDACLVISAQEFPQDLEFGWWSDTTVSCC